VIDENAAVLFSVCGVMIFKDFLKNCKADDSAISLFIERYRTLGSICSVLFSLVARLAFT
jgi:hypothetical protein